MNDEHSNRAVEIDNLLHILDEIRLSDPPEVIRIATGLFTVALKAEDWEVASRCQCEISSAYLRLGNFLNAVAPAQSALAIAQANQLSILEAKALGALAIIYAQVGDYASALECFVKEHRIALEQEQFDLVDTALNGIAFVYGETGETAKAIAIYQVELENLEKVLTKSPRQAERHALTYHNWGQLYHKANNTSYAIEYYWRALTLAEEWNIVYIKNYALTSLVKAYCDLKRIDQAQQTLDQLEELYVKTGTIQDATLFHIRGQLALTRHRFSEAIELCQESLEAAKHSGDQLTILSALETLIEAYRESDDYETALNYFAEYHKEKTLFVHDQSRMRHDVVSAMQYTNQLRHEAEIQRLRSENAEQKVADMQRTEELRMEQARLQERQHIANELHDSVSQSLYMISATVQSMLMDAEHLPHSVYEELTGLNRLAKTSLAEMRTLLNELRPLFVEDQPLAKLLMQLVDTMRARVTANISADVVNAQLPEDIKLAFYRITQESFNNIAKHAQASEISVHFHELRNGYRLAISDNGRGFELTEVKDGIGLHSIRERAEQNDMALEVKTSPGKGTMIEVRWLSPKPTKST